MPRQKKKKESRLYPIGKEELRALPASPARRTACAPIYESVVVKIETQLATERQLILLAAARELEAKQLYASLVDFKLKALAK